MPAQATILTAKFGLPIEHAHTHTNTQLEDLKGSKQMFLLEEVQDLTEL